MKAWEYMRVTMLYKTANKLDPETRTDVQTWTTSFSIAKPDGSTESVEAGEGFSFLVLLNELGAEGWDLVSETVRKTTITAGALGWNDVGTPISIVYTFKRERESGRQG